MIHIIIPAYNEEKNLAVLLKRIDILMKEDDLEYLVLIVNDGSRDGTLALVEQYRRFMPVTVVTHQINLGVAAAFRTGFHEVLKSAGPRDIIITMEADNTSDIYILEKMMAKIGAGDDLVLASCYAKGGGVEGTTKLRMFLSTSANGLIRMFFPLSDIHTYSSFYRAYRTGLLKKAMHTYKDKFIEEKGFVSVVEMLIKFKALGARISEVPMVLKGSLREGSSKMKIIPTINGYLRVIWKYYFVRRLLQRKGAPV